jgi:hypothetical protein
MNEVEVGTTRLRVGGINCLAVPPEYRRHGLGSALMDAAHRHMREAGCAVGLLSTQIVAWYRKLGWEQAGRLRDFHINRSNVGLLPCLDRGLAMRVAGEDAIGEVVRLRGQDRLGGIRNETTLRLIWNARGKPRIVLAERNGRAEAYLAGSDRAVTEWAGPGPVVAGLLRAWFESTDAPAVSTSARDPQFRPLIRDEMVVTAPDAAHPFVALLNELGLPSGLRYAGVFRLLDPQGLLDAFGRSDIRAEARGGDIAFTRGRQTCALSLPLATKLLFGPERVAPFAADALPLPFCQWGIEHV